MTPQLYHQLKEHFVAARDLPPADRAAYLGRVAGNDPALRNEIENLLAAHDVEERQPHETPPQPPSFPAHIAGYRILGLLGEGGMGVVFEAEQARPRRRVALKVIRPGVVSPLLLRRFQQEAQVLGRLQHPGIAQIFEAGVAEVGTDRQPYFAMEFVAGQPVTDYAQRVGLDLRARLELLARIGDAVEHAHQRGVIHRDLKPANILVAADGQPKILDFGIARAVDAEGESTRLRTETGQLLGTVPYMSPEQFEANLETLDTRVDIYALGVVGFELLTGRLPFELAGKGLLSAARTIREEQPLRLGQVSRTFRGDPETIIQKALEKDRLRRYASAAELAADIRRYLAHHPIRARPPSRVYEVRQMIARHRALAAMLALVFALLLGFGGWMSVLYARADQNLRLAHTAERKADAAATEARTEAETARRVSQFLGGVLDAGDRRQSANRDLTIRDVIERAATRIETELHDEPAVRASVLTTLSRVCANASGYDERAVDFARAAVALRRAQFGPRDAQTAESLGALGFALGQAGDFAAAERAMREALDIWRAVFGDQHQHVARALADVGLALENQGRLQESAETLREALRAYEALPDVSPAARGYVMNDLGQVLSKLDRYDEALPLLRRALATLRAAPDAEPLRIANTLNTLGGTLNRVGALPQAEEALRESLELRRQMYGEDDPFLLITKSNLAQVMERQGDYAGAVVLLRETLRVRQDSLPAGHPQLASTMNVLGNALTILGELDEAETLLSQALSIRRRILPPYHPELSNTLMNWAALRQARGDFDTADRSLREALDIRRHAYGEQHNIVARTLAQMGRLRKQMGNPNEARCLLEQSVAMHRALGSDANLARSLVSAATLCEDDGALAGAENYLAEALTIFQQVLPPNHADNTDCAAQLARVTARRVEKTR